MKNIQVVGIVGAGQMGEASLKWQLRQDSPLFFLMLSKIH